MKRKLNQKILAFVLAMIFLASCNVTSVAATVPAENGVGQTVLQDSGVSGSAAGLKDYSIPTDQKHAYDPFAQMETEEATEAYRQSVQYEDGTVIFKLSQTDTFLLGEKRKTGDEDLSSLGIDPETMEPLAVRKVEDGFFQDTYEITYRADLTGDVWSAVDALAETEGVLAAQPNYLYEDTAIGVPTVAKNPHKDKQWQHGPDHLDCDKHWQHMYDEDITPGEGSIVAVIDTGVDYTHPDLAANMWVNVAELNGVAGVDDDGNGYVDDIHGASTVGATYYHSGDPMDDHGHGTHVAGIIAMTANNDEGAVGLAYGAKIMAIKAGQATGIFSDTDIAEAINYAVANGADVINMSFGGAGQSFLVEEALSDAFATCVLVAAAGNDSYPTSEAPEWFFKYKVDTYPASYSFVLGVMASDEDNNLAEFSNWDYYGSSTKYELIAPGTDIFSTIPGGGYASWDGTSMSAPLVSAAAALIRSKYSDKNTYSSRFIMGQLSAATEDFVIYVDRRDAVFDPDCKHIFAALNLEDSLNRIPSPSLSIQHLYLFDSPSIDPANDGDGIVDVGETIDLGLVLRNQWGLAENVTVTVTSTSSNGIPNPNIEWITDTVEMEPIGTFNEQDNSFVWENDALVGTANPLRFKVKETTINDAHIGFDITVTCSNGLDKEDTASYTYDPDGYELTFYVQRGRTLSGVINEDMTLTADDYWIVEGPVLIPKGVTLTVEEGTQIQFYPSDYDNTAKASLQVEDGGNLNLNGTELNPIEMFPSAAFSSYCVEVSARDYLRIGGFAKYAKIINPVLELDLAEHLILTQSKKTEIQISISIDDCTSSMIKNLNTTRYGTPSQINGTYSNVILDNCESYRSTSAEFENCTFLGCSNRNELSYYAYTPSYTHEVYESDIVCWGGKKYVLYQTRFEISNVLLSVNRLLQSRGGTLLCINSQEELDFLRGNEKIDSSGKIGLIYDDRLEKMLWVDGTDGFIPEEVSGGYYYNLNFGSDSTSYFTTRFIAEYPDTVPNSEIVAPFTVEELRFFGQFNNNALISQGLNFSSYERYLSSVQPYQSMVCNYWGTTNEDLINERIHDFDDGDFKRYDILCSPYLTLESPELEMIYPFVTEAYITDTEGNRIASCGNQEIQLHVKFNRDMDQSVQPMVSYGPAEPYTDYLVDGEWVSAREWVGTTKVTSVIDAGTEYIRVKDAVAADDGWLKTGTDEARFAFEIERTGAQALTLQAEGGENKISLNWSQDDYATLAGYNVYRATSADGTFTKINERMIPGTIRQFVDTDVEPGKEYFYYFTVLTTSLTESNPSNIASATAIDNVKPSLTHTVITQANFGQPISFAATATDNIAVSYVRVFYRAKGAEDWKVLELSNTEGDNYYGVISATEVSADGMEYYMEASDGTSAERYGSPLFPLQIAVDRSLAIFTASPYKAEVSDVAAGVTATVTGANFTDTMTLKVGGITTEYTFVSESQISFTLPAGNIGDADVVLTDGTRTARLTHAFTYVDGDSEIQIVAPGEAKSGEQIRLPILLSADGNIDSVYLELKLTKSYYSKIAFEKAEGNENILFSCNATSSGVVKLAVSAFDALDLSKPIGYLVLDVNRVAKTETTGVEITKAQINTIDVASRMGCKLEVKPNFSISGKITYYKSSEGIAGVTVRLSNGMTAVTDENGVYTFTGITTNSIVVVPEFTGSVNGALSSQDASLVLQAVTGEGASLNDLQLLAADVDGDGNLSARDASYILKKSLGAIEGEFPGSGREWTFDDTAKVITLTDNVTNVDFKGILLGDVSGNWTSTPVDNME